jgi:hypothetical protein
MFDPETFTQTTFTDSMSTRREPVPAGEYQASVEKISPEVTQNGSPLLRVTWRLVSFENEEVNNRLIDQTIWLDTTPSGALDLSKGKNTGLGRFREAIGQNVQGVPWAPAMSIGQTATVSVSHRSDKEDASILYDQIKSVTKPR